MITSDIIIIGAGPGGYETAVLAAKKGKTVTIIESAKVGGTCLNEGCIPTKAFCRNAAVMDDLKEAETYGIDSCSFTFNFQKVLERKNQVVETLRGGVETLLKQKNIQLVYGKAAFKDAHTVEVNGEEYQAENIIIATGSVTKYLPIEGLHQENVITSKEILDIDHVPQRLCIIGAGVIGLEFASIFNSFGSKVTVVEFMKEILPNFDTDIAKRLKQSLSKKGIEIINQAGVKSVEKNADGSLNVNYELKGAIKSCEADTVLLAVGRAANVDSLNLADINIEFTKKGITVNDDMQTNIPHIYAIGDVNGRCLLAHAATFQGIRALNHILGEKDDIRLDIVPGAVFTSPEAAMVGLTEEQCKVQGIAFTAKKAFFRANGKAISMNEPDGMCKILADSEGKILGCHLFGAHAADLVQEVCALMNRNATVYDMQAIIHAHPTLGEVVQTAAHEF